MQRNAYGNRNENEYGIYVFSHLFLNTDIEKIK